MDSENNRRNRLQNIEPLRLYPLVRSSKVQACALYWLPVYSSPLAWREKEWLMAFFDELHDVLVKKHKLRQESFLQMKLVAPLGAPKDLLHRNQMELMPLMGLSRKPGAKLPPIPTEEDLEPVLKGKKKFEFNDYVGDYCMWFLSRKERWRRDLFLGFGGYTMLYLAPDLKNAPPPIPDFPALRANPVFEKYDLDAMWETTFLLSDSFGPKSKGVFGKGFEEEPSFGGISFIIPLLNARNFLDAPGEVIDEWFTVFDVFIQESTDDTGILIASKFDLDEELSTILKTLRERNFEHPLAPREAAHDVAS